MKFLISGITGHVGGAAAERLLASGDQVRALVRDPNRAGAWADRGVELVPGDLTDAAAIASALEGVDGAYLMIPPHIAPSRDLRETRPVVAAFAEALRRTPPPRLVLLSSVGSEQESGLGNIGSTHVMETELADLPFPVAIVRAGGFMENYVSMLGRVKETGVFDSFMQPVDKAFPTIATADIGAEVARLLTSEWTGRRIVELGSLVTPNELAAAMGAALGRPVEARAIPREAWSSVLQAFGFPEGGTEMYEEMMDGFNSGWIHFGVEGTEPVAGTASPVEFYSRAAQGV